MRLPGFSLAFLLAVLLVSTTPVGTGTGLHQLDLLHPLFNHFHVVNGRILTHAQLAASGVPVTASPTNGLGAPEVSRQAREVGPGAPEASRQAREVGPEAPEVSRQAREVGPALGAGGGGAPIDGGLDVSPVGLLQPTLLLPVTLTESVLEDTVSARGREEAPPDPPPVV